MTQPLVTSLIFDNPIDLRITIKTERIYFAFSRFKIISFSGSFSIKIVSWLPGRLGHSGLAIDDDSSSLLFGMLACKFANPYQEMTLSDKDLQNLIIKITNNDFF